MISVVLVFIVTLKLFMVTINVTINYEKSL